MTGLTKLQLCNNIIEKIENLEMLTNLKELDLSFNNIHKIENLETLVHIEVLTLFENRIETIENIENMTKLTIFSIGNNRIQDKSNVIYLRQFENLRSLNLAGNPLCKEDQFLLFIYAFLPQLVYYEYRMIKLEAREEAKNLFSNDLRLLEREEAEVNEAKQVALDEARKEAFYCEIFIEELSGDQLFSSMYEDDPDGKALLLMNEEVMELYQEFMQNFGLVTKDLFNFGLEQHSIRLEEIRQYEDCMKAAKEESHNECRKILEDFLEEKKELFAKIKTMISSKEEDDAKIAEMSADMQEMTDAFQDLCQITWHSLMHKELHLFEAMEEANGQYERNMTDLVNVFVEGAQAFFTQMRNLQNSFNETITDLANKFITHLTVALATGAASEDEAELPSQLLAVMTDREQLTNALSSSHDHHLLIIDQREDRLVSRVKTWLAKLVEDVVKEEVERSRAKVVEINHFLDIQREELEEMTSTPLGLMLLPQEVQDALQI